MSKKLRNTSSFGRLISYPFPCPNCDERITEAFLFCSDLCKDEAKFVRYYRACLLDGRDELPDVQEALRIRMAHLLNGGYPEDERQLSKAVRDAVIARDKGRCRKCRKPGNQIDHLRGNSDGLANLQVLCSRCHN